MKKSLILALVILVCCMSANAQYQTVKDIPYVSGGNQYAKERCKLDVYYPTDKKDVPVVVWFHGGGLEGGEKYIDPELMNAGYTVV